jgi:hypothetical protein
MAPMNRCGPVLILGLPILVTLTGIATAQTPTANKAPTSEIKDTNTPRTFPEVRSKTQWQERAKRIRKHILISCGLWPLPQKTRLPARVFGKLERDGYTVEKVYFQTYPGFYLAGNLYRPLGKSCGPFPGVVNPHGHWNEGRLSENKDGSIAVDPIC